MKKYQLKYQYEDELVVKAESDEIVDIMKYLNTEAWLINNYTLWMDGKVLD